MSRTTFPGLLLALILLCPPPAAMAAVGGDEPVRLDLSLRQPVGHAVLSDLFAAAPHAVSLSVATTQPDRLDLTLGEEAVVPDRAGLRKDTYYFLASQFFVIGILYVMPEDLSGWSDEQKDSFRFSKYRDNISEVVWDSDKWYINYLLHPYWGGAYYVRARERGYDDDQAFWYSFLLSTMFEFGAEAMFERPSIQDLILTPGFGYFFGHYFMRLREDVRVRLRAGHEPGIRDRTVLVITDPLGAVNRVFDRLFGIEGDYVFTPFVPMSSGRVALHPDDMDEAPYAGRSAEIVPGLMLNLRW